MAGIGRSPPSKCLLVTVLTAVITTVMMVVILRQDRSPDVLVTDSLMRFIGNLTRTYAADVRYPKMKEMHHCSVVPEVPSWDEFYDYVLDHQPCAHTVVLGGVSGPTTHGAKTACTDLGFAPPEHNCTVLSFGINNEFSFDDAIADKMGCDVYAFDPTMNQPDHLRGKRIHFFDLGLGAGDGLGSARVGWPDKAKTVKVDSYIGILNRLNLLNTTIDYLKMDIEESELHFFRNTIDDHPELLKTIRQIGMEIHFGRLNIELRNEFWWYLHQMRCHKFRPVVSDITGGGENIYRIGKRVVSAAYEIVWVNDAFMKLVL